MAARDMVWDAELEQQIARLENQMSSSSGVEDAEDSRKRKTPAERSSKSYVQRHLQSTCSVELHAIAEEWERAHTAIADQASDLRALKERITRGLLSAHRAGDLERIAEEMASQAERKAHEVRELKERVFRAMNQMKETRQMEQEDKDGRMREVEIQALHESSLLKRAWKGMVASRRSRSKEVEQIADETLQSAADIDDVQKELEMKALQLRSLMKRAWKGMLESKRSTELERIADEMAEQIDTKAKSIKNRTRKALLRAHRAGELADLRDELDEMVDVMPEKPTPSAPAGPRQKRWAEYSSDSDTTFIVRDTASRTSHAEADVSGSDAEGSKAFAHFPG